MFGRFLPHKCIQIEVPLSASTSEPYPLLFCQLVHLHRLLICWLVNSMLVNKLQCELRAVTTMFEHLFEQLRHVQRNDCFADGMRITDKP